MTGRADKSSRGKRESKSITVIDLFAGPGGLSEGFSSVMRKKHHSFRIAVSVEKDEHAHKTLSLRAFYRWFLYKGKRVPPDYYRHLTGDIDLEDLFARHPEAYAEVQKEALLAELGNPKYQPIIDEAIRSAVKGQDNWLLIGGPPCQAYSLVGRSRMQSAADYKKKRGHDFADDPRHKLYREYLHIIAMYSPSVFVMENVKGILSAKLDGERIFPKILADLRSPYAAAAEYGWDNVKEFKYRILSFVTGEYPDPGNEAEYLIRTEQYGVPQARHRIILLGIREDVFRSIRDKVNPLQKAEPFFIENVIRQLPPLRSGFSKGRDSGERWRNFFCDMKSAGWINSVDEKVRKEILAAIEVLEEQPLSREYKGGGKFVPEVLGDWYGDNKLKRLLNHETRSHMDSDLDRYLFVSAFGAAHNRSPHLRDFPTGLLPKHKNVDQSANDQKFSDRFKVQLWGEPASTITSHISKDGHYFIHPDPTQCRSLTVREAARVQTFPDNYCFEGGRTQQYHQVGNAVPPLLARQLAEIVWDIFIRSESVI